MGGVFVTKFNVSLFSSGCTIQSLFDSMIKFGNLVQLTWIENSYEIESEFYNCLLVFTNGPGDPPFSTS